MEMSFKIGTSSQNQLAGSLCISVPHVTPKCNNLKILELFNQHKDLLGLPVLESKHPIGMINRHFFLSQMTRPFFRELYDHKSCIAFMDKEPLVIDVNSTLDYLAEQVVATGDKAITEGFIFTSGGYFMGIGLGIDLIKTVSDLHIQQHKQIMQSIEYARVIQDSMLENSSRAIKQQFDDWCLIWQPRDTVGGDFYAFQRYASGWLAVIADCTGHGVPGAFMTVIFSSALEKALTLVAPDQPDRLLQILNQHIKQTLYQLQRSHNNNLSNDGCDAIALYADTAQHRLVWANANMSAFLLPVQGVTASLLAKDRTGIGYVETPSDFHWSRHEYQLKKGDKLLVVTDGVTDQIGGHNRIMFGKKRIQTLLEQHQHQPMSALSDALQTALRVWQDKQNLRDDMTWFGFTW